MKKTILTLMAAISMGVSVRAGDIQVDGNLTVLSNLTIQGNVVGLNASCITNGTLPVSVMPTNGIWNAQGLMITNVELRGVTGLNAAVDPASLGGYVATNDSRLNDAREPLSHTQNVSTITGLGTAAFRDAGDFAVNQNGQAMVVNIATSAVVVTDANPDAEANGLYISYDYRTYTKLGDPRWVTWIDEQNSFTVVFRSDGVGYPYMAYCLPPANLNRIVFGSNMGSLTISWVSPTNFVSLLTSNDAVMAFYPRNENPAHYASDQITNRFTDIVYANTSDFVVNSNGQAYAVHYTYDYSRIMVDSTRAGFLEGISPYECPPSGVYEDFGQGEWEGYYFSAPGNSWGLDKNSGFVYGSQFAYTNTTPNSPVGLFLPTEDKFTGYIRTRWVATATNYVQLLPATEAAAGYYPLTKNPSNYISATLTLPLSITDIPMGIYTNR